MRNVSDRTEHHATIQVWFQEFIIIIIIDKQEVTVDSSHLHTIRHVQVHTTV